MDKTYAIPDFLTRHARRMGSATLVSALLLANAAAQNVSLYSFNSSGGGTLDAMGGASVLIGSNQDDTPSAVTGIGFAFNYEGTNYTEFSVNSNGGMKLGGAQIGGSAINFNLTSNPLVLLPYSGDGTTANGSVTTVLTGSSPNRVRVVQWNVGMDYSAVSTNCLYQVWLYEGTNVIEFRYGAGAPAGTNSGGMQVAITGANASNYLNVLSGLTASTSNTTLFSTAFANTWPGNGTLLTFSPPAPCTAPAPGNTLAASTSGCPGFSTSLSLQNNTPGSGVSYQWQSSPNGVDTWTNVGTSIATHATGALSATTWFQCLVTCSNGPSTVASTPIEIVVSAPPPTYFTYSGAPFTEDFAGWTDRCSTNDVPDGASYWSNTPAFGPGTWRRSNTTAVESGWDGVGQAGGTTGTLMSGGVNQLAVVQPAARFRNNNSGAIPGSLDFHVDMSSGTGAELLRFEYINSSGGGTLSVLVSTDGGSNFTQVGSTLGITNVAPVGFNTWVTREFTIGSTSATTVIRLRGNPGSGNNLGVDNFRIIPAPTCTAPTAPSASVTGAGAVEVSWTCASCTGSYFVEYGPTGFTLGSGTVAGPFTNSPASITGLANGNYHAYVRQDCGIDGISDNAGPTSFSIVAGDFCSNAIDLVSVPQSDWSVIGNTTGASNDYITSACGVGQPGADIVFFHDVDAGATLSLGAWSNANRLSIAYGGSCPGTTSLACANLGGYLAGANVQLVNDYETLIWTNNGCTTERVYLLADAISAGPVYIFNYAYTPAPGPVCNAVTGSTVNTTNSGTGATVSWSATCSGNVIVEYGPSGFTPGTGATAGAGTAVPVNGSSTTLSGLTLDVTYDVYVRNDCGAGQFSSNGTPVQFTIINGDDCSRVIDLSGEPNMFSATTAGATNDVSVHTCGTFAGGDLYLSHPVGAGATITFFAAHDYAAAVSISYGSSCPGASPLTCEEDLAEFMWTNTTGSTQNIYWIQDGSSEGGFTLEWIYSDPCALDSDADGINDCEDSCIELPGENGDPCYAGPLFTSGEIVNCACVGSGAVPCSNDLTLEFQTDGNPFETSWELIEQGTDFVVQSGGPLNAPNGVETNFTCLPDGCFYLRVYDSAGDGMTTGGYILRTLGTNQRIIDNRNNFNSGSVSAISAGQGFCLPMSNDKVAFTSCDKLDWTNGQYVVASPNPAVSAEWIVGGANSVQDNNSGYEFWIFDPNGSYSFRRFRSHNVSDGFGPASATRACHMKLNNWVLASQVPANTLMNVRVRARINGVNGEFGPACRLAINPALAACPQTKLMDIPGNQFFSCGATRQWGTNNYVHARPVSGANRYQFRFRIAAEGFEVIRTASTYFVQLNWAVLPLQDGKTYDVDVRVSKDGGLTWCTSADPWGNICQLTIDNTPANSGNQNFAAEGGAAELRMFPNPNRGDVLTFSLSAIEEGVNTVSVDIYDLTGKRMSAHTIAVSGGHVNTVLDLNGELAAGMYLVNITVGEKTYTERLVIQP